MDVSVGGDCAGRAVDGFGACLHRGLDLLGSTRAGSTLRFESRTGVALCTAFRRGLSRNLLWVFEWFLNLLVDGLSICGVDNVEIDSHLYLLKEHGMDMDLDPMVLNADCSAVKR